MRIAPPDTHEVARVAAEKMLPQAHLESQRNGERLRLARFSSNA
jgi:hypothetical protein